MKPRIGLTMGDPRGIGPEVAQRALEVHQGKASFVAYAPAGLYEGIADLSYRVPQGDNLPLAAIEQSAIDLREGMIDGVVTSPVNKATFEGRFPGHTELYADRLGRRDVAMMMSGRRLRTVPVTTHLALRDVPDALSVDLYLRIGRVVADFLQASLGLERPKIAVAGLNPHAGDGGLFGDEEETILAPAVAELRRLGIDAQGPFSPDTVFYHAVSGRYDVVLCPYHDQALIPFKLLHFTDGVNVTLGLGKVRTSPDHGPAWDIAGQGIADPTSMVEALGLAIAMSR